jgi:hypothetical protein
VLIAVAALVVAAPAAAIIGPWRPLLQRTGVDKPVHTSVSPIAQSARDALAVLRRPQTAEDRARTAPLLTSVGAGNQVDQIQTDGIRSVADGWALVPAKSVKTGPSKAATDELCLTDGQTVACSRASTVGSQGVVVVTAGSGQTNIAGIAPDGVAEVRFTPNAGPPAESRVASNFFALSIPQTAPGTMIKAPPGYNGPSKIPGPPMPTPGTIQWVTDAGKIVGPAKQRIP